MRHALVTGGCGFLGSAIVRELVDRGVRVRVLALPDEPTDNVRGVDLELVRGNVLDLDACRGAVAGVDAVFHAAAIYKDWMPNPGPMYEVNLRGTFNVLEAARRAGVEKIIYTASIVSIGRPAPGELGDENTVYEAWDIDFPYGRSKYHSRVIAEDFARWGTDVRIVLPGIVLGPGDLAPTPSGKLIINTLAGSPPIYIDGGASFVDVRDAARVHVLAAESGRSGERYLATAHNLSNYDFLMAVNAAAGRRRRYRQVPTPVARAMVAGMEAVARRKGSEPQLTRNFFEYSLRPSFYTNRKAIQELGASFRALDETLRDAISYFKARGLLALRS
jgi:dihydroflavonol-4-reductase